MKKCMLIIGITLAIFCTSIVCYADSEVVNVTYFVGEEIVDSREYSVGEQISAPMIACDDGYAVTSWRTASGEIYDFSSFIGESLNLYAELSLLPATARVDTLKFTYDGEMHKLKISSVYHPLESRGGFYTFEWYRDGVVISEEEFVNVRDVSDSGEYGLKVTFNLDGKSSSIIYDSIFVEVEKQILKPPTVESIAYTGGLVTPALEESPHYEFDKIFVKDTGNYFLKITLSDKENYRWSGTDSDSVLVGFSVFPSGNGLVNSDSNAKSGFTRIGGVLFLLSLAFAGAALVLIIIARKNADKVTVVRKSASVSKTDETDEDFDDEVRFSIQLGDIDTEYKLNKMDAARANALLSDSMAKNMIKKSDETVCARGTKRASVSIGLISDSFYPDECVNIESLIEQGLINSDVGYVSIFEDGEIDKPLKIYANEITPTAVKMIVLSGGEVYKC